ncbi:MAG: hypothetical protein ACI3YL_05250 [Prevotella sp.]|nr:hypothetical protein [Prevotella sp.]MCI5855071.1 hypothetical protein [Prevotella sp.]MDD6737879.1 hypothetical protein [Prevotella sp.]MDY6092255.1 hypothetical protein [Prevotella sp.]
MDTNEKVLTVFQSRLQQLILRHNALKQENNELYAMVDKAESEVKALKEALEQKERDYEALKIARMLEVSDDDIEMSRTRLNHLIREVNKCISLLTNQK